MPVSHRTGAHTIEVFRVEDGEREELETGSVEFVGQWLVFETDNGFEAIPAHRVTRIRGSRRTGR